MDGSEFDISRKGFLTSMDYDEKERAERKAFLQLTDAEIALLKELGPVIAPHADQVAHAFYDHLLKFEETRGILSDESLRTRLIGVQKAYLERLFSGDYGADYYESRLRIGFAHDRINLLPKWYLGAYALYVTLLGPLLEEHFGTDRAAASRAFVALQKVLHLDMQLAMEAYILSSREALRETNRELEALNEQLEERVEKRTRELAASEGRYRSVIEMSPDMICQVERDGRFEQLNRRILDRLGYSHEELVDQTHDFIVQDKERKRYLKEFSKVREAGYNQYETVLATREGAGVEVEVYAVLVDPGNSDSPIRIYLKDVTERNRMHRQVEQAQKLAAVGKLSSILAHEVRNPLNAMGLHLSILERRAGEAGEESKGRTLRTIENIRGEVDRLAELVNDFLLLARPGDITREPSDLHALIDDVLHLEQPRAEETGIVIVREYEKDIPPILADGDKLKQAMLNLVTNAMDAMAGGGTLTVRTGRAGDFALVQFQDTGPGIPPDENVFELFFTTKSRGSGMGLNIVEGIVQQHGGRLDLESEPGEGACLSIHLPLEI